MFGHRLKRSILHFGIEAISVLMKKERQPDTAGPLSVAASLSSRVMLQLELTLFLCRYCVLDKRATLKDNLRLKTIVEFPEFFVVLSSKLSSYHLQSGR